MIAVVRSSRQVAQRTLSELDVGMSIRAAASGRDRMMLQVAYFGALRVSELHGPR
jgi:site-specific recombinase XerC